MSDFHRFLAVYLTRLGVQHSVEHFTEDGLYSIDCAVPSVMAALEVEGPKHFTANTYEVLAPTAWRHKMLEARGWTVRWVVVGGGQQGVQGVLVEVW
jgi:hypothetical protein